MGNHRFKLSDMMPNAWFYKLKDIGSRRRRRPPPPSSTTTTRRNNAPPPSANSTRFSYPRKSYYFTREFPPTPKSSTFPRKSNSSNQTKLKTNNKSSSSVSAGCNSCRSTLSVNKSSASPPIIPPPDYSASSSSYSSADDSFRSDRILPTESFDQMVAWSSSDKIGESYADAEDIIINVDSKSLARDFDKLDLSDLDLPPIITKPVVQFDDKVEDMKKMKKKQKQKEKTVEKPKNRKSFAGYNANNASLINSNRRHVNSPGLRLRVNSPRIGSRRIGGRKSLSSSSSSNSRRSLSDSLAIVKASFDPQKDFRESMVEMIVENNIKASKDLEDLLACYLSLNSDEYHDLIIKVFKQIWLDLTETPAK